MENCIFALGEGGGKLFFACAFELVYITHYCPLALRVKLAISGRSCCFNLKSNTYLCSSDRSK